MQRPKLLEIISDMRAEGATDEEIVSNLRQLGLSDEQIKEIMKIADQDVYSKFKREMVFFVRKQFEKNKDLIKRIVDEAIAERMDYIKKEVSRGIESQIGELARVVNKKTSDVEALGKAIRQENLAVREEVKAMRADVDLLLAGPTKMRLILSAFLMLVGVAIVAYSILAVTPNVLAMNFADAVQAAILLGTGGMYVIFGIIAMLVGLHIYGKPA